jgi:hypothetical protein
MDRGDGMKQSGRGSLVSVFVTALAITVNHGYARRAG